MFHFNDRYFYRIHQIKVFRCITGYVASVCQQIYGDPDTFLSQVPCNDKAVAAVVSAAGDDADPGS